MAFLKVLSCSLIFIVAGAFFIDAQLLAARQYNVQFILHDNQDVFHGEYNINIYILSNTQHIHFYTENLSIIKAIVTNNTQISEEKVFTHRPENFFYETKTYTTTITFPYVLSPGNYILYLKFSGLLAEDGGFRTSYMNEQNNKVWLAATHYHTFATRRLFPLLKFIVRHACYNISIKHHKNYTALSNMPVEEYEEMNIDTNNMMWTHFQNTPKMPANMITAGLVQLALKQNPIVNFWYRTGIVSSLQFAHIAATSITLFLETKWPYIWRIEQRNNIVIPKLLSEDEEEIKLGLILYKEADIIFNEETDSEIRKIEISRIIAYKTVQERLYNVFIYNSSTWEPWLSKGFAMFFGIYAIDKVFPHSQLQDFCVVQTQHDFLHWSTKGIWPFTIKSEFNSYFEIPRYIKANIMFHKLQNELTDEVFQKGVKMYLNNSETSSSDFWNVMESTLDKLPLRMKYNLEDKITNWIQIDYYPVINAERNYNINHLNISAENFYTNILIIANIFTRTHSKLKEFLFEEWLRPKILTYATLSLYFIDENDWILVDVQSGCYRVNYDAENWNRLSIYLNSNFFENIHVLDRAKIIDDSFHFVMTGRLNFTVFLRISHYLSQDTNYTAWYPMFKHLEYVSGFFAFPEHVYLKEEIELPLIGILSKIKYPRFEESYMSNKENIFIKCLKEEAARWLCNIDYYHCLAEANDKLISYLKRYRNLSHKLWPGWKEWTFCKGLMIAKNKTWMEVFDIYLKESDSNVLKYLACSKNSSIILQYINLMANITNVKAIDHINSFCFIVARHANNNLVLNFILDNLEKIKPKEISFITALTIIINHIYSEKQFNKIFKFLNLKENMKNIIMDVNRKLALRWCQIGAQLYQYRYLIKDFNDNFRVY
ncbi:aminopeptidase N-like [Camponotus floridanus]|uniref:aminopeptidase N-like n=1 Tax=Camponotus floridanus TaxID=104421 RepID=UPI000DC6960C|nr:aminopeptidase N-like [Camponotus floridanus]